MTTSERLLKQLGERASASVIDPSRWTECVSTISALTDSAGVALFRPSAAPVDGNLGVHGSFVAGVRSYFEHWIHHDPWNLALSDSGRFQHAGEIIVSDELLPTEEFRRTAYFQEHARHLDGGHKLFVKVTGAGDQGVAHTHLTLGRSLRQAPYDAATVSLMRRVLPMLRAAVQAGAALSDRPRTSAADAGSLGLMAEPCFVVRRDRTIEFANPAGECALALGRWFGVAASRLQQVGDADSSVIDHLLSLADQDLGTRRMVALDAAAGLTLQRGVLHAVPIRKSKLSAIWPAAAALMFVCVESIEDDQRWINEHLARRFRLSPAECRVLTLIVEGHEAEHVATTLRVSLLTVRTHLRSLREKTERRSLAQLMRLGLGR